MGRSRYRFGRKDAPHFLTASLVGWLPVFSDPACVEIVLAIWRFQQERQGLRIHAFVIMENHIHWIAQAADLPRLTAGFKSYAARQLVNHWRRKGRKSLLAEMAFRKKAHKTDRTYQVWQEGSHPVMIRDEEMMRKCIEYIHANPVRRGYVDAPEHWRYSSARNYLGIDGVLKVETNW